MGVRGGGAAVCGAETASPHQYRKVVQVDYSLVNRTPEEELLPYCQKQAIAVMVRGPLARGLLSGRYNMDSVFEDSIRETYNKGGEERAVFEERMAKVEKIRAAVPEGEDMLATALRYVISHETDPVAIPGAKSPQQAADNAAAGSDTLGEGELARLRV